MKRTFASSVSTFFYGKFCQRYVLSIWLVVALGVGTLAGMPSQRVANGKTPSPHFLVANPSKLPSAFPLLTFEKGEMNVLSTMVAGKASSPLVIAIEGGIGPVLTVSCKTSAFAVCFLGNTKGNIEVKTKIRRPGYTEVIKPNGEYIVFLLSKKPKENEYVATHKFDFFKFPTIVSAKAYLTKEGEQARSQNEGSPFRL